MDKPERQNSFHKRQKTSPSPALPPRNTQRWVKSKKLAVLMAIDNGTLCENEACERYGLSEEELHSWRNLVNSFGPDALRATHIQSYRQSL